MAIDARNSRAVKCAIKGPPPSASRLCGPGACAPRLRSGVGDGRLTKKAFDHASAVGRMALLAGDLRTAEVALIRAFAIGTALRAPPEVMREIGLGIWRAMAP